MIPHEEGASGAGSSPEDEIMSASLEQGALGPESFESDTYDPATEIATKVMALPWASRGLTDPRSGVFDHDALGDRHGAIQTIADKVIRAASAPASGAERMTAGEDILAATHQEFQRRNGFHRREIEELLSEFGELLLSKVQPAPATPPGVPDSVRALSEDARDLLNSVLDWLRGVCPCGNAGPAQCPVCGARIDDSTGFCAMGHRCKIPAHLLGRIERALGIATHPAGQSAGSGAAPIAVVQSLKDADWSGASIGNKLLIVAAIDALEKLTAQLRERKTTPDSTRTGDEGTETEPLSLNQIEDAISYSIHVCRNDSILVSQRRLLEWREGIRAMIAARTAAPEAQGAETPWKPISTAPRNDKLVMLGWWCDVGGEPRWIAVAGWYEAGPADRCWYAAYDEERVEPTHWQPLDRLPAPPASSGQGGR